MSTVLFIASCSIWLLTACDPVSETNISNPDSSTINNLDTVNAEYEALIPKEHFGFDVYTWEKKGYNNSLYTYYDFDRGVELVISVSFSKSGKKSYSSISSVNWTNKKSLSNPKHPANDTGWDYLSKELSWRIDDPAMLMKEITPKGKPIESVDEENIENDEQNITSSESVSDDSLPEGMVWVPTSGGTKYHSRSSCGNIQSPIQVSLEQAENNGYTACKRCY